MDNLEKTEGTIKSGQSRENGRDNQESTIQRKQNGQSRMDNLKKTEGTIKNGQFRDTCNFRHTNRTIGNTDPTQKTWSQPVRDDGRRMFR